MHPLPKALLLGSAVIGVATLAVFGIVPDEVARYAPLAVVPFLLAGHPACRLSRKGQGA